MRVRWQNAAKEELAQVAEWYEDRQAGLGLEFLDEVDVLVEDLRQNAQRFPRYENAPARRDVRRASFKRFPHQVLFELIANQVWVVAIAHPSRKPQYWTKRLKSPLPSDDLE
jgi:plasmid stabilization system protein ParE